MNKLVRKITLASFCLLVMLQVTAQEQTKTTGGNITGKVVDSVTAEPVEYATISLFLQGGKKPVNGSITAADGSYTITDVAPGTYKVVIECIGFRPINFMTTTADTKNTNTELGNTRIARNQGTLQNVTVTTSAGLIQNKIDKLVFNAEKDITSQVGVATDILKKIPQVSVDVDGNVQLAGSSSIKFLINGKPSTAFGSNVADVLQSIPASQIKSIEVITNPGARYEAQGLGGIINIILKQNKVKGINGNLSLTGGTLNENGSLNMNYRKDEFGLNVFVSGNARRPATVKNITNRITNDTAGKKNSLLAQDSRSQFKRHGFESGFGFDWTLKKNNNFNGSFRYGQFGNSGNGITDQLQTVTDQTTGNLFSNTVFTSYTNNKSQYHNTDISLGYIRKFKKEDQELEINFDASKENSNGRASNYQLLQPQDSLYYGVNNRNPGSEKDLELSIDYTQPLKEEVSWGLGGEYQHFVISSNSTVNTFDPINRLYDYDTSLSNSLNYKQDVYALYSELSFPLGKLSAKIGGRYERTEIQSYYSNAQQQAGKHGYNTFVPSIFFLKKINELQTLKLSYSKRIERPDYNDLNPFVNTTDPKNISAGNPYLLPEIGHRFEFSYSRNFNKAGSFMFTAFYRINENDIQPFIVFYPSLLVGDSVYTNVNVTARQNIGRENNRGLNAFIDWHPNDKLALRSNLSFYQRHTINAIDKGYNSDSYNYRFNLNASYQFTPTLAGEFFGNFNSPRNEAQGRYPSFTSYSFALRKQFWNKKGSLALSATNPFALYVKQHTQVFGPNFTVDGLRQIPFRSIGLNFTWKFGKLEFKKEKDNAPDPGMGGEGGNQ